MGMAASQARLLQLTNRKNTIGSELSSLSLQKMSLTREMSKVSKEYNEALNSKVLKWSNNAGVTYVDLSYQNLMTPSDMNQQTPYLITDINGSIIVDSSYHKYAQMISPDGGAGGDWESVRSQVLESLTGIPAETIENMDSYSNNVSDAQQAVWDLEDNKPELPFQKGTAEEFVKNLGSSTGYDVAPFENKSNWADAYKNNDNIILSLENQEQASTALNQICDYVAATLGQCVDDPENMQSACETVKSDLNGIIDTADKAGDYSAIQHEGLLYKLNVTEFIDLILGAYSAVSENDVINDYGNTEYIWYDKDSSEYKSAEAELEEWQAQYDAAMENYNTSNNTKNELLTADQENQIAFYDTLFSSIAEKGWTYNSRVSDTDYLNQMLQNNMYTLTTVNTNRELDSETGEYTWENSYETDIASNFDNVFTVNDNSAANEAMAEYEYKKNIINEKETRIDTRMQDLETEQSAINQMIQGIEQVRNDNTERNFSIFT